MTYVDENGTSVYGQAIKTLGERSSCLAHHYSSAAIVSRTFF